MVRNRRLNAWIVAGVLIAVGVTHLLPIAGVFGGDTLNSLYGVHIDDANVALLMRHRAVLFGLLGVGLIGAAFKPAWQMAALIAAVISTGSFVALAGTVDAVTPQIDRVVVIDAVALALLAVAGVIRTIDQRRE